MRPPSKLTSRLTAAVAPPTVPPHVIVVARAGTGKTTTLVEGLKRLKGMPTRIEPSPQQAAVWDAIDLSKDAKTICFCAFNKAIATELQARVPQGCDAMTMHSMGLKAVTKAFGRVEVTSYRVLDIISRLLERDIRDLRKDCPILLKATEELVGLCKQNLIDCDDFNLSRAAIDAGYSSDNPPPGWDERPTWDDALDKLVSHYQVELANGKDYQREVYDLVPRVLEKCADPAYDRRIDFNDMIWLPVVLDLLVFRYDLLLVDECQDLNRCQQALAKKAGKRLILCGDPKQAIYGFAGADARSMKRMEEELSGCVCKPDGLDHRKIASILGASSATCMKCGQGAAGPGCIVLPLTVTRRCGKAIVAAASEFVKDFEAHETCSEGVVRSAKYPIQGGYTDQRGEHVPKRELAWEDVYCAEAQSGDMVLCRVNAPLVSQCFRFLKRGIKANIRGRDIAQGLISTIEKLHAATVPDLVGKVTDWLNSELDKENAKRIPSEGKLIMLSDRADCLLAFADSATSVQDVIDKINSVFSDDSNGSGILLSSVHKSKGLEAKRVFILMPRGASMPHSMARSEWQLEQEYNLKYVAITRAIDELVWVS